LHETCNKNTLQKRNTREKNVKFSTWNNLNADLGISLRINLEIPASNQRDTVRGFPGKRVGNQSKGYSPGFPGA
jgi:hypothetical protein